MRKLLAVCFLFFLLTCFGCQNQHKPPIYIATSSNTQFAVEEAAQLFEEQTGIPCELVVTSSGKLSAQIREGAPYQVFISADMRYPQELHKLGLTKTEPQIYAKGALVLWSSVSEDYCTFEQLSQDVIQHIAMANPATAPYGRAAAEALEKQDLLVSLDTKFVYGESIGQTNQFLLSGAAEVGFTAMSTVRSAAMSNGYYVAVDPSLYTPIEQGVVVLANKERQESAQQFVDFLLSPACDAVFERYGYLR